MKAALSAPRSAPSAFGRILPASGWTMMLAALGLAGWLAILMLMPQMDGGAGRPPHDLPMFLAGWVIMLAAMMLPSELTYIGAFAALLKARGDMPGAHPRRMLCFMAGYGVAWGAYGLAAYGLDAMIRALAGAAGPEALSGYRAGPLLAGSALVAAGLYQVSALKQSCLTHCRTPLSFFARHWREGGFGATVMGIRHGVVCVGCCWALMAVMFVVGTMNLTWMALLTLIMFAEKVLPLGRQLTLPIACFFWIMGLWVALSPETAPLLKDPLVFGGSICRSL